MFIVMVSLDSKYYQHELKTIHLITIQKLNVIIATFPTEKVVMLLYKESDPSSEKQAEVEKVKIDTMWRVDR